MSHAIVRAKFKVSSVSPQGDPVSTVRVTLAPVSTGSEENNQFFAATPGGQVDLQVVSPATAAAFVEGEEYYVDFTPAAE